MERGKPRLEGGGRRRGEVSKPVIFAILTTIAAFAPLLTVEGNTGKIMRQIPLIVIATLVFSLVESLLVLPPTCRTCRTARRAGSRPYAARWQRFRRGFPPASAGRSSGYKPSLAWASPGAT
jgi:multidrug efflux pump subunit AcrB